MLRLASRFHAFITPPLRRLNSAIGPNHQIYLSHSTNPYFNLTFEDWLFRHAPKHNPLLLLYRCEPSVIIGRNQNPWKEVNFRALRSPQHRRVHFVRRRSGGGTVYHDLGNTNFSIHLSRTSFDRQHTAMLVERALHSMGIDDASVNERNDICVRGEKIRSAYKIANNRAYHHGTMLISTQLSDLGELLSVDKPTMHTKGVASVRSPVTNLRTYSPEVAVTHDTFVNAVVRVFREEYNVDEPVVDVHEHPDILQMEYIRKGMAELPSWEWAYGQSPEFTYALERRFEWGEVHADLRSKHGVILSCSLSCTNGSSDFHNPAVQSALEHISNALSGPENNVRYADEDALRGAVFGSGTGSRDVRREGEDADTGGEREKVLRDVMGWLVDAME